MTDLPQAIAELKRTTDAAHPFVASHFSDCSILSGQEQETATILNAVASGEMVPLADAKLAVALVVEKAENLTREIVSLEAMCDHDCDNEDCVRCFHYPEILEQKKAARSALADTDALAELQALRARAEKAEKQASDEFGRRIAAELLRDSLAAREAELEARVEKAERDRVAEWNRRRDADGSRDAAIAACDSMRAELAATQAKLARAVEALSLAANRLHRCSVDYDAGTKKFIEVGEWAKEARAELTALEGAKP